jgi:hypothetical protein
MLHSFEGCSPTLQHHYHPYHLHDRPVLGATGTKYQKTAAKLQIVLTTIQIAAMMLLLARLPHKKLD